MFRYRFAYYPLWLAALLAQMLVIEGKAAELPETITKVKSSIVVIGTVQPLRQPSAKFLGTGFAIGDGLHLLTNSHVIPKMLETEQVEYLAAFTDDGAAAKIRKATLVVNDPEHDLCVLKIEGPPLRAMKLGNSDSVREGQRYVFTGFPIGMVLGFHPVTHEAIISAITPIVVPTLSSTDLTPRLVKQMRSPYRVFQLDATAYPGNSGSPLYDPATGEVVGIVNKAFIQESKEHILKSPSGISYAMPIKFAQDLLKTRGLRF
jgi:S1-C subfamily serine protease